MRGEGRLQTGNRKVGTQNCLPTGYRLLPRREPAPAQAGGAEGRRGREAGDGVSRFAGTSGEIAFRGAEGVMGIKAWDIAAGGLLVREAGGRGYGPETNLRKSGTRYPIPAEISKPSLMALS
jgi:hypothetical protein